MSYHTQAQIIFWLLRKPFYICNNSANIKLTATSTYKRYIAAILLALYAFAATPIQLWHHHKNNTTETNLVTFSDDAKHDTVSKSSDSSSEKGCSICSHKYSASNDDAVFPFESSIILTAAKNGFHRAQVISTPSIFLPNKGPPALS